MPEQEWLPPIQAVDIAPEKKARFPWFNPTTVLIVSAVGYLLDGFKGRPGLFFSWVGLIGLAVGFMMLVNDSVIAGIRKKTQGHNLGLNWFLFVLAIVVGIYISPLAARVLGKL